MPHRPPNSERVNALHRLLSDNESACIKHNIVVRVDTINSERNVAFCSVEQRHTGLFRHTYTPTELVWRAEKALAPLQKLGIVPLLTVRHKNLRVAPPIEGPLMTRSHMDWIPDLWRWLGSPLAREGFGAVPLVRDPFGWKQAMHASSLK